jgi:hypothetical protein
MLFEQKLKLAKIPYYSIEMLIGDRPPMLVNPTLSVRSTTALFYKEALWNRLEKEIPSQYTKIAFLDSDVIFSEPDWLDKMSILLDSCDLVHPFETVDRLNLAYEKCDTLISSVKDRNILGSGMGWSITRESFRAIGGFFDKGILGNGDTLFYNCMVPTINIKNEQYFLIQEFYLAYRTNFQNINPKVTYLNTHIYHLSHGTLKNRKYGSRHNEILGQIRTPWNSLFSLNSDGFWELIDNSLSKKMIDYFISRKEDSQEVDILESTKPIKPVTLTTLMSQPRPMLMKQLEQSQQPKDSKTAQKPQVQEPGKVYVPPVNPVKSPPPKPLKKVIMPLLPLASRNQQQRRI